MYILWKGVVNLKQSVHNYCIPVVFVMLLT